MTGLMIIKNKSKLIDKNSKISTKVLWVMTVISLTNLFYVIVYNWIDP